MSADTPVERNRDGVLNRPVDILDDGILWAINRMLFHPRGFALAFDPSNGEFSLWGNGNEPWRYGPDVVEDAKFRLFEAALRSVTEG